MMEIAFLHFTVPDNSSPQWTFENTWKSFAPAQMKALLSHFFCCHAAGIHLLPLAAVFVCAFGRTHPRTLYTRHTLCSLLSFRRLPPMPLQTVLLDLDPCCFPAFPDCGSGPFWPLAPSNLAPPCLCPLFTIKCRQYRTVYLNRPAAQYPLLRVTVTQLSSRLTKMPLPPSLQLHVCFARRRSVFFLECFCCIINSLSQFPNCKTK